MPRESWAVSTGAGEESRTPDLRITNALLYQLSYTGTASHYSVFDLSALPEPLGQVVASDEVYFVARPEQDTDALV